jgi:hypothetical protein
VAVTLILISGDMGDDPPRVQVFGRWVCDGFCGLYVFHHFHGLVGVVMGDGTSGWCCDGRWYLY